MGYNIRSEPKTDWMNISTTMTAFLEETYVLKALIRYNNKFKVIHESVAEHMYFVSLITLKLSEFYEFDIQRALTMAVIHDLPEIYISDITRDVKNRHPELMEILSKAERDAMVRFGQNFSELFNEFENESSPESLVVSLADALSVKQYTEAEMKLGNKGYMLEVNGSVRKRLKQMYDLVEEYRK
jgi:5'-deoxynucleotidase YfbR-like HD superfamily hydrolase